MFFDQCECTFLVTLDIEANSISKKYIKVCVKHADSVLTENMRKDHYKFSKRKSFYFLRHSSDLGPAKLRSTSSSDSAGEVLDFGKYTGSSFHEVYRKDKAYCANIMKITDKKKDKLPRGMHAFSNFVKQSLSIGGR